MPTVFTTNNCLEGYNNFLKKTNARGRKKGIGSFIVVNMKTLEEESKESRTVYCNRRLNSKKCPLVTSESNK